MNEQQILQTLLKWSGSTEDEFDHGSLLRLRGYLLDSFPTQQKPMLFFIHIVETCQLHLLDGSSNRLSQKQQEVESIYGKKGVTYFHLWRAYLEAKKELIVPLLIDGQRVDLPKAFFNGVIKVRCSWINKIPNAGLGIGAFLLNDSKKIEKLSDIIDDHNNISACKSVYKQHDFDPQKDALHVNMSTLSHHVHTILLWLQMYPNQETSFYAIEDLQLRISDAHQSFFRYEPQAYSGTEKILLLGSIYRTKNNNWRIKAGFGGLTGGLNALKSKYI